MDYELMMNGNVKIGQRAPDFEANTTMRKNIYEWLFSVNGLYYFHTQEISPPYVQQKWLHSQEHIHISNK